MKLFDTILPEAYSKALFEEKKSDLAPEHTDKMAEILFTAVAEVLNEAKSKEKPAAFVFNRIDGSMIAGAVCEYHENDGDQPGNYTLAWTCYKDDIPENATIITFDDPKTHSYFRAYAGTKFGIKFKDPSSLVDLMLYFLEYLIKCLDENAKPNEEFSIELEGVFQARVNVEDNEKVFAIEADGLIKNLIKDDAANEK